MVVRPHLPQLVFLPDGVMAARLALNQLVKVRPLLGQLGKIGEWTQGESPVLGTGHQVGSIPTSPTFILPVQARSRDCDNSNAYMTRKSRMVLTPWHVW